MWLLVPAIISCGMDRVRWWIRLLVAVPVPSAAYNDTAADHHHMAWFARHSLEWLSRNWLAFLSLRENDGLRDMVWEYPMMANDETYEDTTISRFVAEHEIAHTYMPFDGHQ